jgi:hypothetical protein
MTFALGAARSGYIPANHVVHFSAGKKGTNRVRQRTLSDVNGSAGRLAPASNLLGGPGACGRHQDAARMRLRTA